MNALLIHKTKPSQAELLLEDAHDKNLVKHLQRPGDAVLATDYDAPVVVSMPLCTRRDVETVADLLRTRKDSAFQEKLSSVEEPVASSELEEERLEKGIDCPSAASSGRSDSSLIQPSYSSDRPEIIPLARHRKPSQLFAQGKWDPTQISFEMLQDQLQYCKSQDPTLTQAEIARRVGVSQGYLSRILNGQSPLNDKLKQKLYAVLFESEAATKTSRSRSSFHFWKQRKISAQ
jgi:hypothetical protein